VNWYNDTSEFSQPSPGLLQFSNPAYTVNENGTVVGTAITVNRIGGNKGAVGATLTLTDGTAVAADYTNTPIAINFAAGDTTPKIVTIPIADDAIDEADETVNLSLTNPTGNATVGDRYNKAVLTIADNDSPPTVSIAPATINQAEGNTGTTAYNYTVSLSNAFGLPITVNYKTDNGTATTGDLDYEDNDGNLIFNSPEVLTKTIAVIVNGDNKLEANETFSVTLNNATNATIDPAANQSTGIILNSGRNSD